MAESYRRRCRGPNCRREIGLLPTQGGGRIPLDPAPHPNGNVRIDRDLFGEPFATVLSIPGAQAAREAGVTLFMPHHATCPDVDQFREAGR